MAAVEQSPPPPLLERADKVLEKGARLLNERQKLIKIATRLENGWGVVAEYTANELTEDSEDEKWLEKAEKVAEKRKYTSTQQPNSNLSAFKDRRASMGTVIPPLQWKQQQAVPTVSVAGARRAATTAPRAVGPGFACGEMGHPRSNWMQNQKEELYPYMPRHECAFVKNVCAVQTEWCRCFGSCAHVNKSGVCCFNSCVHVNMSGVRSCDSEAHVNMSCVRCCNGAVIVVPV